ncbi:helicase-associated domain-containing protein [Corynebacterium kutscheri]|uniref:DNA-binding protein n=1 Tax=Corynebacterium kutscheri TaxID=35755 RepID=A0AB38VPG8_9CORY|nr:helicase-associated domain-containing protein [Corynebacterium kutscheri]VEH04436.1 putative DNA-binding protein [Corynebacterium kutscheri]
MTSFSPTAAFSTWLETTDTQQLARIIHTRRDVLYPIPPTTSAFMGRLEIGYSQNEASLSLNAPALIVLETLRVLGGGIHPIDHPELYALTSSLLGSQHTSAGLGRLYDAALAFPIDDSSALAPHAAEVSAFGRFHVDFPGLPTAADISASFSTLTKPQLFLLRNILRQGGSTIMRENYHDLIKNGILIQLDARTVRLSEVTRALLRQETPRVINYVELERRKASDITTQATGQGLEVVRLMRMMLSFLRITPLPLLKNNALGVRPLAHLAKELRSNELTTLRLIGIALAAGLIERGALRPTPEPEDLSSYLGVTELSETWEQADLAQQWYLLAIAWLNQATFAAWLVGTPGTTNKPLRALEDETFIGSLPAAKANLLCLFSTSEQPLIIEDFASVAAIDSPLRAARLHPQIRDHILHEARFLGLLVDNQGTIFARDICHQIEALATTMTQHTPAITEQLIIQPDMTIVAPGPLSWEMHKFLSSIADIESYGVASIYRLNNESVRRGLDHGHSSEEMINFLRRYHGDLPQAIEFLITDAATEHGTIRGGLATSYIRANNPLLIDAIMNSAISSSLSLRRIAPEILISSLPLGTLITTLGEHGFHIAAENNTGELIDILGAGYQVSAPVKTHPPLITQEVIARMVHTLRPTSNASLEPQISSTTEKIKAAIATNQQIQVVLKADSTTINDSSTQLLVSPIMIHAGVLTAIDTAGVRRSIALDKIEQVTTS